MDFVQQIAGRIGRPAEKLSSDDFRNFVSEVLSIAADIKAKQKREKSVKWRQAAEAVLDVKINILRQRPVTISRYKYILRRIVKLSPEFADKYLCDITVSDCVAMLNKFPTPTSREFDRRAISCVFVHGLKFGWCAENPLLKIYRLKPEERKIKALTPSQISDLFRACRPAMVSEKHTQTGRRMGVLGAGMDLTNVRAALALMVFGGIRPFEVRRLDWSDVSFEDSVISIRGHAAKTGMTRHVTMCAVMRAWLMSCTDKTGAICPAGWCYRWAGVRHRAGWDSIQNPWMEDSLRHTFAGYHAKTYKNFPELQIEMGHCSSRLLWARYANMEGISSEMASKFWTITPDTLFCGNEHF